MSKPMKLLVATDFSVTGRHAGEIAVDCAERFDAQLDWVHCTSGMPGGVSPSAAPLLANYVARARKYGSGQLRSAVEQARERGLESDSHLVDGDPGKAILKIAKEIGADALILGSHGRTGLKRAWLGSVAEGIVRDAPCSVLVVRGPDSPLAPLPIVVGDDLSSCSKPARKAALRIAEATGAPVEFIHSLDLGIPYLPSVESLVTSDLFERVYDEAGEQLADAASDTDDVKVENRVVSEQPANALCEIACDLESALIVVGSHSREGLSHAILGSVAERVVRNSPCSVLVVRDD